MKKILIVTSWFEWAWWGKMGAILENFLNKSYETVTLVCFEDKWIFDIKWKKINLWFLFNSWFPWRWYLELLPHIIGTIKYIKKEKPNIVIWIWTYCNFLCLIAHLFLKFKLLLTQHEHISTQKATMWLFNLYRIIFYLTKKIIWDTKIVCVSNEVKNDTIKNFCIKSIQAQTIYNWLDFDEILRLWKEKINIWENYIINVWRLGIWKNQELLIKAYSQSRIREKYKLLLLWEWSYEQYLKELCKKLNVEKYVIFLWFDKNPYKYLSRASLFCFTSKTEALPTVLIESLILGIPIITVPVTWSREVLNNGEFWIITKDYDELTLVKELNNFVEKWNDSLKNLRLAFLNNNFSWKTMERKYIEAINSL